MRDEADHRLFVGSHVPPRLAVFHTASGKMVAALRTVEDLDDVDFEADRKRVYVPGGGYFGKAEKASTGFSLLYPARGRQSAEFRIYTVQD